MSRKIPPKRVKETEAAYEQLLTAYYELLKAIDFKFLPSRLLSRVCRPGGRMPDIPTRDGHHILRQLKDDPNIKIEIRDCADGVSAFMEEERLIRELKPKFNLRLSVE